jgi:hypothetical protein
MICPVTDGAEIGTSDTSRRRVTGRCGAYELGRVINAFVSSARSGIDQLDVGVVDASWPGEVAHLCVLATRAAQARFPSQPQPVERLQLTGVVANQRTDAQSPVDQYVTVTN